MENGEEISKEELKRQLEEVYKKKVLEVYIEPSGRILASFQERAWIVVGYYSKERGLLNELSRL